MIDEDVEGLSREDNRITERASLGAMLRGGLEVVAEVATVLRKEDYYNDAHQKVFDCILTLHDRGLPADLVSVANLLHERRQVEDIGSYGYLGELYELGMPSAALVYARKVRDAALARQLGHLAVEMQAEAKAHTRPAEELLEDVERRVYALSQHAREGSTVVLRQAIQETFDEIDRASAAGQPQSVPTGLGDLDIKTTGLVNSEMVVIAARPSVGKTGLALNMAAHAAVEEGLPVFFVSLEQPRGQLTARLLCKMAGVDHQLLRTGRLTDADVSKLVGVRERIQEAPLHFDDTPMQTMRRIAANARRLKARHGIRAVFLDYLQLVEPEDRRAPRFDQVSLVSRKIKLLARELAIPVVALAQINRESEKRADSRPRISDLRESGNIECDADTIILLSGGPRPELLLVDVAKQRNGPTGEVYVEFKKNQCRFETYAGGFVGD